jgi:hypothetical protein
MDGYEAPLALTDVKMIDSHLAMTDDNHAHSHGSLMTSSFDHVANGEEACEMVCRMGGVAFLSPRGAASAAKDGVALCTLGEEDLFLSTHLVARAENGSMLVSEFARNLVKRLKQACLYQPVPSESPIDANCAA